ncbi:MAG: hypothetical protein K1Y36_07700 [Blastocatellia bacterium]|nr:hypothetical protein [Blastocatellia bacterium]
MKGLIVYALFFALLYFFFRKMMVWMHVSMSGWQFIIFVVVLFGIAEFARTRIMSDRNY